MCVVVVVVGSFVISWHCCLFSIIKHIQPGFLKNLYVIHSKYMWKINTTNRRKLNEKNYVPYRHFLLTMSLLFSLRYPSNGFFSIWIFFCAATYKKAMLDRAKYERAEHRKRERGIKLVCCKLIKKKCVGKLCIVAAKNAVEFIMMGQKQ